MTSKMTQTEAVAYAATWGSYMRAGDPGSCMYGFSPETGLKVQSEYHRENCLEWIEGCKKNVEANPENEAFEENELELLDELARMIQTADIA